MARTTGPLLSLDASGSIGGAMTFSKWKGRNYVRKLVIPDNPKSAKQTGVRAMMSYLAQLWTSVTAPNKATWDTLAATKDISPFNAFVGENLARWQTNKGPTQGYPAAETDVPGAVTSNAAVGHAGYAVLSVVLPAAAARAGIIVYRDSAEITVPNWANAVAVLPASVDAGTQVYTDSPLVAGTYHYRTAAITDDGVIGTACADAATNPVVT
jgi:hypothetical protein